MKTIKIPLTWLERLIELGDNDGFVDYLQGYIESAKWMVEQEKARAHKEKMMLESKPPFSN